MLGLLIAAGPRVASAHASLARSVPAANAVLGAAPTELRLWFSEAPEPPFTSVQLLDRAGQPVAAVGALRVDVADKAQLVSDLSPLADGVYTVVWRATSAVDGHVTSGTFSFAIGPGQLPSPAAAEGAGSVAGSEPNLLDTVVRWLGFLALAMLAGGFAFYPLVFRPALDRPANARAGDAVGALARAEGAAQAAARERTAPQPVAAEGSPIPGYLLSALSVALALAVLSTMLGAMTQAASSAGVGLLETLGTPLATLLFATKHGLLIWARLSLLAFLGVLLFVSTTRMRHRVSLGETWWWAGAVASALVLLTISLGSHAAAIDPIAGPAADWLHLLAMSVWVGGLASLSLAIPHMLRQPDRYHAGAIGGLVGRFSLVAALAVAVLVATGAMRAIAEVGDLAALFDTPYGATLLLKLGLLAPLLGLAAVNLLYVKPQINRSGTEASPPSALAPARSPTPTGERRPKLRAGTRLLRLTVAGEVLFGLAVLFVTAALTASPPGRNAFGPGTILRGQAGGARVVLAVNPGQVGQNSFDLYVRDAAGKPVDDALKVALIFQMTDHAVGENEAVASSVGAGRYHLQGSYVSMPGVWQVQALVRRRGLEDARIDMTFEPRTVSSRPPVRAMPIELIGAIGLVVLGGFLAVVGWRKSAEQPVIGVIAFCVGLALAGYGTTAAIRAASAPSSAVTSSVAASPWQA